jgi:hypothetical protein
MISMTSTTFVRTGRHPVGSTRESTSARINPWLAYSDDFRALWETAEDGKVSRSIRQSEVFEIDLPYDNSEHSEPKNLDAIVLREMRAAVSKTLDTEDVKIGVYAEHSPKFAVENGNTVTAEVPRHDKDGNIVRDEEDKPITKNVPVRHYSLFLGQKSVKQAETVPDVNGDAADKTPDAPVETPATA